LGGDGKFPEGQEGVDTTCSRAECREDAEAASSLFLIVDRSIEGEYILWNGPVLTEMSWGSIGG